MKWPLMHDNITFQDKLKLIKFILTSNKFTNGKKVLEFEKKWSEWLGCKYSLFVSSGSTANFILIAAIKELYKIPINSKVLLPACTWVTNVSPIIQLGLKPVFCDISLNDLSFDIENLPEDDDIRIVFVTYLLGFNTNIELLKKKYPNAIFLEDICESHGVTDDTMKKRGSDSSIGSTFSFYYGHHITTIEGGMVCTNNHDLYKLLRMKRSHGLARELSTEDYKIVIEQYPYINSKFLFMTDGYNFRNTELGAVLGISQLNKLDNIITIRKRNYSYFINKLNNYNDLFYMTNSACTNSNFSFPFICKNKSYKKCLEQLLQNNGIETRPIVGGNLLVQPFLKDYSGIEMKNANILNENGFYIGNNQYVTIKMIDNLFKLIEQTRYVT